MQRVRLLRKILPNRQQYGCQGYGHRLHMLPQVHDETEKTGIPRTMLPPVWPTRLNSIFGNLGSYDNRVSTWREYAEQIVELRRSLLASFQNLQRVLGIYFRRLKETNLINSHLDRGPMGTLSYLNFSLPTSSTRRSR